MSMEIMNRKTFNEHLYLKINTFLSYLFILTEYITSYILYMLWYVPAIFSDLRFCFPAERCPTHNLNFKNVKALKELGKGQIIIFLTCNREVYIWKWGGGYYIKIELIEVQWNSTYWMILFIVYTRQDTPCTLWFIVGNQFEKLLKMKSSSL